MEIKKDIKPIFQWANQYGDANINDRILVKIIPQLLKNKINLTDEIINTSDTIEVNIDIYDLIQLKAQELVGDTYKG